jgi:hypothetical protein
MTNLKLFSITIIVPVFVFCLLSFSLPIVKKISLECQLIHSFIYSTKEAHHQCFRIIQGTVQIVRRRWRLVVDRSW